MGKVAFVFSGQGDQFPGMGKELAEQYPSAAEVFEMCDQIRPGTSALCFEGTAEELRETKNTQPCLFAMELAAAAVLREMGITPDAVAGFSLGELTACAASGAVEPEVGFRLVCRRGELMQQAAEKQETAMAAVVKLTQAQVEELCGTYENVYPVNFNYPGQVSVAGLGTEMASFAADVKAAGGRAIPLKVKGAFHTPFMAEASEEFARELGKVEFHKNSVDLYSDVTAQPYGDDMEGLLARQMCSPVRWEDLIHNMIADGIDTFVEIGPGKTLSNMITRIDSGVKTFSVSEMSAVLAGVCAC